MVKYFDLSRQYKGLNKKIPIKVTQTLASGRYILGSEVEAFEESFAKYCGVKYGVGVASGTDALILALRALGIGEGDEVIVPSFTFVASVFAVMHTGAKPVFVDVDPKTYTIDPCGIERMVTRRTRAILPVHLYGQAADMSRLKRIAKKFRLFLIEDAAQAHGAFWRGKKVGSFGDVGCFSFYPTKNLGAFGDGGIVTTSNKKVRERLRKLRNLGRTNMKDVFKQHDELGVTSRLDAIQAAILNIKLKHLDHFNANRRKIARIYRKYLQGTPLVLPSEGAERKHVYHLFVVRVPNKRRKALRSHLEKNGIPTMIHYPTPVHRQPPCINKKFRRSDLKVTMQLSSEILSLPIFPEMKESEVKKVCAAIHGFYQ